MSHLNTSLDALHKECDKETLNETFRKNGLVYKLLGRTAKAALFELKLPTGEVSGYEVCRIHLRRACMLNGREYPEAEVTPSNSEFGDDGSRSFFPYDLERAKDFLREFTLQLQKFNVEV